MFDEKSYGVEDTYHKSQEGTNGVKTTGILDDCMTA